MRSFLSLGLIGLGLLVPCVSMAGVSGQVINCDNPNPAYPQYCVDNWALDAIDESRADIESARSLGQPLPRNGKYYFKNDGTGVHVFTVDTGMDVDNPEFMELDAPSTPRTGTQFVSYLFNDRDGGSHGTRVNGIISGVKFGIAKDATVHPVRAIGAVERYIRDILNWIEDQVVNQGASPAVLNISMNIPPAELEAIEPGYENAITTILQRLINQRNVVVVASAGNKNGNPNDYWPSKVPGVIVVGGLDEYGNRWIRQSEYQELCVQLGDCGSNYGSAVDIWAPAKYSRSAIDPKFNYAPLIRSGTSYAAPLVTGVAALLLEAQPWLTPAGVLSQLLSNSANLGDVDGNGTNDHMLRSPVTLGTYDCNVPQRLFSNANTAVPFTTRDLVESCPSGYSASGVSMPSHGVLHILGIAPDGLSYEYAPNTSYEGPDNFSYSIYTGTGSYYGTGTVKVIVQEDVN